MVEGKAQRVGHEEDNFVVLDNLSFGHEIAVFLVCRSSVARDLTSPFLDLDFRLREDLCCRVTDMPQAFGEWDSPEFRLEFEKVVGSGCEQWNAQGRRHGVFDL